jgi:hypothetical protein
MHKGVDSKQSEVAKLPCHEVNPKIRSWKPFQFHTMPVQCHAILP